jgi:hypothetical protein
MTLAPPKPAVSDQVHFVAVNRERAIALDDEDNIWDIKTWLCDRGCLSDQEEAVVAVAHFEGYWASIDLSDFEEAKLN